MPLSVEQLFVLKPGLPIDENRIDVFQGQGANVPGMGKELYNSLPAVKEVFESANDILGYRLSDIMFHGSQEELSQPEVSPVATTTENLAAFAAARIHYPHLKETNPSFLAGHSHGEYTAAMVDGVLGFEDGLRISAERGSLMYKAGESQKGRMAVVLGMGKDDVREECYKVERIAKEEDPEAVLEIANYNSPEQIVVSGSQLLIARFKAALPNVKIKDLPLLLAAHTSLMKSTIPILSQRFTEIKYGEPVVPILSNGEVLSTAERVISTLRGNAAMQVDWVMNINSAVGKGIKQVNEYGAGKLNGLVKRITNQLNRNNY